MTDNTSWDAEREDFVVVQETPLVAEHPAEEAVVEEPVKAKAPKNVKAAAEKPTWGLHARGYYGPKGDYLAVEHSGEQVSYINQALGLSGDEYTGDTFKAVADFQRANRLTVTGRVDKSTYLAL